ncbi:carbamoyl phosphate synthase-like protein [Bremerella volcania]|uniref:Carbamoyl phosphate synthase-like protein n=1 Tax=Bremerella volcania TaxID=2527984 RepID=A0A518C7L9_9BACT|nr:ATP-grasp domain-containing protein [Bremerella volcania]QDU75192.1 carbamoyl phosphate synthase-like protein [Bremerella volcania]
MTSRPSNPRSVFVYELITGGGLYCVPGSPAPSGSLLKEGTAMLAAVVDDFAAIDGLKVTVLRDSRLPTLSVAASQQITVEGPEGERTAFHDAVKSTEATLVIAPEFDGLHYERTKWAEEDGAFLLSPDSTFVEQASCKWKCFQRWRDASVRTIDTFQVHQRSTWEHLLDLPVVTKPSDGAGSEGVLSWNAGFEVNGQFVDSEKYLIQPKVYGDAVSCAALGNGADFFLLPAAFQTLDKDLKYHGGSLPIPLDLNVRAHRLAAQAIRAMPPFRGYVGLDMILGPSPEGKEDVAVDLNPRLTSSYVGLRLLLKNNLAQAMLDVVAGRDFEPRVGCGEVDFEIL